MKYPHEVYSTFKKYIKERFCCITYTYIRASNSSRNSWTSNIEYLAIKYSNSSSISNIRNTTRNGWKYEPQIANFWPFSLEYWPRYLIFIHIKQKPIKIRFVRAMHSCRINVRLQKFCETNLYFCTQTFKSKNYVKSTYCSVKWFHE